VKHPIVKGHKHGPIIPAPAANQTLKTGVLFPMIWAELSTSSKFKKHDDYDQFYVELPTTGGTAFVITYN